MKMSINYLAQLQGYNYSNNEKKLKEEKCRLTIRRKSQAVRLFLALKHMCDFKNVIDTGFFPKVVYMYISVLKLDPDYTFPIIKTLQGEIISQGKRTLGNI